MQVNISDISIPKTYLRRTKKSQVDYLHQIAKDGGAPAKWILDPIEVASNGVTKPTKKKINGKSQLIKPWELSDGGHRIKVALRFKLKTIEAKTVNLKDPGERHFRQYKTNSDHGLKLDPADRNQFIWNMVHTFKWPQDRVAKETGLHKASISRIAAKKQGWKGWKSEAMRRKPRASEEAEEGKNGAILSPNQYADHLEILVEDWQKQKTECLAALKDKFGNRLKDFIMNQLGGMVKEIYGSLQ